MDRRTFVRTVCGSSLLGVAGCLSDNSSDNPVGGNGTTDDPNDNSSPTDTPEDESPEEPTPAADGPSYDFEGNGDFESDQFSLEEGLLTIDFRNWGTRHDINTFKMGDDYSRSILNETYENGFDGTVARYVAAGEYQLIISDASQWNATVRQPRFSEVEYESLPYEGEGVDYALVGPFEFSRGTEVTLSGENNVGTGSMDFHTLQGNRAAILANGGGYDDPQYEISATVKQSGPGFIYVDTMGTWTLTIDPK